MKKRLLFTILILGMFFTGCGKKEMIDVPEFEQVEETKTESDAETGEKLTENKEGVLDFSELDNLEFYFASGAGGWRTVLRIKEDGCFVGSYSDSDLGSTGEGYPNGTYYYCAFEGKFGEPVKINDYTYTMRIEEISCENEPDTKEIIDEILYYYSFPYGLEETESVLLYLPGAPMEELPEEYKNWVRNDMQDTDVKELPFYGLYNEAQQNGFSSYHVRSVIDDMMASAEYRSDTVKTSLEQDNLSQLEMNTKSKELYDIWDEILNTLWGELKETLSEEEFAELLEEQRAWIGEKETAVEEAGKMYEGGSMYLLAVNMEAADWTEARVYELYDMLCKE